MAKPKRAAEPDEDELKTPNPSGKRRRVTAAADGTEKQAAGAAAVVLALKTPERVYTHIPFTMGNTTPVAAPVALAIAVVVNEISAEPLAPSRSSSTADKRTFFTAMTTYPTMSDFSVI